MISRKKVNANIKKIVQIFSPFRLLRSCCLSTIGCWGVGIRNSKCGLKSGLFVFKLSLVEGENTFGDLLFLFLGRPTPKFGKEKKIKLCEEKKFNAPATLFHITFFNPIPTGLCHVITVIWVDSTHGR